MEKGLKHGHAKYTRLLGLSATTPYSAQTGSVEMNDSPPLATESLETNRSGPSAKPKSDPPVLGTSQEVRRGLVSEVAVFMLRPRRKTIRVTLPYNLLANMPPRPCPVCHVFRRAWIASAELQMTRLAISNTGFQG